VHRIVIFLALAFIGCGSESSAGATATTKDPATARTWITNGATVIDVRTSDEYAGEHLANATNLPLDQLPQQMGEVEKLVGGDKSKPIVVYCASGRRSAKAKQQLEAAGFTMVVNGGGYKDVK
jgi:phage shock protein E